MTVLSCDVCGGSLLIDAGGKTATCQYCGVKHSIERMREKVQEIKGTVSIEGNVNVAGTANVENLLVRAREFEEEGDCANAEEYYNRVLDLEPANEEAKTGLKKVHELNNPVVGKLYYGRIVRLMQFDAYVEIAKGKEGLIHISRLDKGRVENVEDVISVGDMVWVKLMEIDEKERWNFSRKDALADIEAQQNAQQ